MCNKYFLTSICLLLFSMGILAQKLKFAGISMGIDISQFEKQLQEKGFTRIKQSYKSGQTNPYLGTYLTYKTQLVATYDTQTRKVYKLETYTLFNSIVDAVDYVKQIEAILDYQCDGLVIPQEFEKLEDGTRLKTFLNYSRYGQGQRLTAGGHIALLSSESSYEFAVHVIYVDHIAKPVDSYGGFR